MSNSLVSVIIPVYNLEKYVKEAIKSIQNQTYENLEIIVIDDGSIDDTYNIVEKLAKEDNRIKLYKNEKNLKIVKTLNRALSLANGEYIARMDGDDISVPDRIEKKVRFLEENKDISLVGCSLISIDRQGHEIKKVEKIQDFNLIRKTLRYTSPISHIWVCRKSVYDKLHENIYKMYELRLKGISDDFDKYKFPQPFKISNKLYLIASDFFNQARLAYIKKQYLKMILNLIFSLISPHQIYMYYLRVSYKLKVKGKL